MPVGNQVASFQKDVFCNLNVIAQKGKTHCIYVSFILMLHILIKNKNKRSERVRTVFMQVRISTHNLPLVLQEIHKGPHGLRIPLCV